MTQLPPNDGSRIQVTIKGSASRPVTTDGRVPFTKVTLQAGAQRSHIIPQEVFKKLPDLFQKIGNPDPSSGVKPFDPNNWRDNGQGLSDPDFQIAGGDVLVKRALYNTIEQGDRSRRRWRRHNACRKSLNKSRPQCYEYRDVA